MRLLLLSVTVALSVLITSSAANAQNIEEIKTEIQERIENGIQHGGITVGDIYLFNNTNMARYYIDNGFDPIWEEEQNRKDFIEILLGSHDVGLLPEDYHQTRIRELVNKVADGTATPDVYADIDLLMTDAITLYGNHLIYGKTRQSDLRMTWDVPENPPPDNLAELFEQALSTDDLITLFAALGPQHFMYKNLKKGLSEYRRLAESGGWPRIPDGDTLKMGMKNDRVAVMRARLMITGDLAVSDVAEDSELFDDALEDAVRRFQLRHYLTQDGVAGKYTLARMNVPIDKRIDQIRINLERSRWVMHELEPDFLVVNVAGFNIRRVTDDEVVYYSPVIVGKTYHESPIFKAARMQYLVVNPTWTLPYSIATKETLPKLQRDPGYLADKNMIIMDRSGKTLDPYTIDFSKYSKHNFPFTIRQEPGPNNALGEVKFIFPNPYSVYVHDTPNRNLFSREERAFSHGCIRLQNTWDLLMSLMDEPEVWNMDKINEILASGKTTTVHLSDPIDVLILYWTAGADKEGRIVFSEDIYQRDPAILVKLDEPWPYRTVE